MIEFDIDDKIYRAKTKPDEMTLGEFEKVSEIAASQKDPIDKMLTILEIVGDKGLADAITTGGVLLFSQALNLEYNPEEIKPVFEINGRTYRYNSDPRAVVFKTIEKLILSEKQSTTAMFAVMYEDTQLTANEHKDLAHIKHKMKLFAELPAHECIPAIIEIGKKIAENAKMTNESLAMAATPAK